MFSSSEAASAGLRAVTQIYDLFSCELSLWLRFRSSKTGIHSLRLIFIKFPSKVWAYFLYSNDIWEYGTGKAATD